MKIHEIINNKTQKYLFDNQIWETDGDDLFKSGTNISITGEYYLKEILEADFEPVVDWSKVEVDTPVIVNTGIKYDKAHFAGYEKGTDEVLVFYNGRSKWTGEDLTKIRLYPSQVRLVEMESMNEFRTIEDYDKMIFDFEHWRNNDVAIHFKSQAEIKEFAKLTNSCLLEAMTKGKNEAYVECSTGGNAILNAIVISSKEKFEERDYEILEWSELRKFKEVE